MKNRFIFVLLAVFVQTLLFPIFAKVVLVEKAGKLKKVLLKEHLENAHSLTIAGEINGTDFLTLKEMPFLKHLDLRNCHIKKGGKVYYKDKYRKLKLKTEDNTFTPYLFDSSFKSLQSIVLPESLLSVEKNSIDFAVKLKSVHITGRNTKFLYGPIDSIWDKLIFILDSYDLLNCLSGKGNWVKYLNICGGDIGDMAFFNYLNLKSVVLEDNVLSLGESAFKGCVDLLSINIYGSVKELKKSTFEDCKSLKTIELQYGLEKINDRCFYGCSSLIGVDIPNTVLEIGNSVFEGCSSLSEFKFPDKLSSIGSKSFANTKLISLKLPESLISIGDYAWEKCPLKKIEYPKYILDIGENNFSSVDSIYMNSSQKPMGNINGLDITILVPDGSFKNYQEWSEEAYIVDVKNPICRTIDLNKGYNSNTIRYVDTLRVIGKMDSESFDMLINKIKTAKCLDFSKVKYSTSKMEIGVAHSAFLEEEKKKKDDKALSELLGLVAAGTSFYAEYFMGPLTGTMTKIIADEVQKSMDEDVKKYEEGVFYADTVENHLILSHNLSHIKNLSSIYLPSNIDNLIVDMVNNLPLNVYLNELPLKKNEFKYINHVKFFLPATYEQFVKNNPYWQNVKYQLINIE